MLGALFKSLKEGISFPTIGLDEKDPECDLFYTSNVFVEKDLKYAISSSFGFGGHNAVLCFKKYED